MRLNKLLLLLFVFLLFVSPASRAQSADIEAGGATFTARSATFAGVTLPYREAQIHGEAGKRALVIYLHGGSSKGGDNAAQLKEPAVAAIAAYLDSAGVAATFVVPQCPKDKSWGGTMNAVVRGLITACLNRPDIDAQRVYALGGSMGGTGTWSLVSDNPRLFAAAMPVAGDPSRCNAETVAQTPVYTVMGTADEIMSIDKVRNFLGQLDSFGGVSFLDIEEGWTHQDTCERSYTPERLTWLFAQHRDAGGDTGIAGQTTGAVGTPTYYTPDGRRVASPRRGSVVISRSPERGGGYITRKVVMH